MEKIVKVRSGLTFSEFGCDADHFEKHIKDKPLRVVTEYREISMVKDETDEEFTVNKEDIINVTDLPHA